MRLRRRDSGAVQGIGVSDSWSVVTKAERHAWGVVAKAEGYGC
ncbi:hypothetical protein E1A91_A13G050800v1 [Gossypium mustelinum]|uniref:Uncharacterized protein n=1 Tax=Gossypium mustelinum TaxID=34275 RepID=A0A5D2WG79_GOSMU|nr:hypothetical protein E1A91_A13G050800v1 [Gossypium mustelinum]